MNVHASVGYAAISAANPDQPVEKSVDKRLPPARLSPYRCLEAPSEGNLAMTWTLPPPVPLGAEVACCYCGRRPPRDPGLVRSAGWQVRYDYPVRLRCRRCRERQEREAA